MNITIKSLKTLYFVVWAIPLLLALAYQIGLLGYGGQLQNHPTASYICQTVAIVSSLVVIYLALKLFKLKAIARRIRRATQADAQRCYIRWSLIRYGAITLVICLDLYVYLATKSMSGVWCAIITLISVSFCLPSQQEIDIIRTKQP